LEDTGKEQSQFTIRTLLQHTETVAILIGGAGTLFALYLSFVFKADANTQGGTIGLLILSQYLIPILLLSFIFMNVFHFLRLLRIIVGGAYRSAAFFPILLHRKQYVASAIGLSSGIALSFSLALLLSVALQYSYLAYKEQKYFMHERVRQTIIAQANDEIKFGRLTSAIKYFERVEAIFPDDGRNRLLSSRIEEIRDREKKAIEFMQAAEKFLASGDAASAFIYADIAKDLFPEVYSENDVLSALHNEIRENSEPYSAILLSCEKADYKEAFRLWEKFKLRLLSGIVLPTGPEEGEWLCSVEPSLAMRSLILESLQ
jgi:tetratricopeptide (TPR) repeat protein